MKNTFFNKTSELQVGDWVRLAYNKDKKCVKVICIYQNTIDTDYEDESLHGRHSDFEIEPIRLTTDILKKNGFTYGITKEEKELEKIISFNKRWVFEKKDLTIEFFFNSGHKNRNYLKVSLKENIGMRFCGCTNVHELQNCLRLCGLDDLAKNFKV